MGAGGRDQRVMIIGGGPAGLTAGLELVRRGAAVVVFEKQVRVGGLAQTAEYRGYRFDIGGHRFFTKSQRVRDFWHEVLAEHFLSVPRMSRIYYRNRFFHYPLKPLDALVGLGPVNSLLMVASYLWSRMFPIREETNIEQWITNRFGKKLFNTFFKTYTEKVWGIPCTEIKAEWAAQRIKGLSLWRAILSALFPSQKGDVKTLIDRFEYPRLGPGMMWEAVRDLIRQRQGQVRMNSTVKTIFWDHTGVTGVRVDCDGVEETWRGTHYLSSMPLRELIRSMTPPPPEAVVRAAAGIRYRDFLTVALVIDRQDIFPDNWIYIHSPDVKVGRIQNFKNWSPDMVADPDKTCLGLEYFAFEGDDLWRLSDDQLKQVAIQEVQYLKFAEPHEVVDAVVVRAPKAYPMYDEAYQEHVETIRAWLKRLPNLQVMGRNGMHKYNNQDHSMMTAMLAVENIFGGAYDLWKVNIDAQYHEEQEQGEVQEVDRAAATPSAVPAPHVKPRARVDVPR